MYFLTVAEFEGQVSVHTDSYGITEQPTLEECASPSKLNPLWFWWAPGTQPGSAHHTVPGFGHPHSINIFIYNTKAAVP